MAFFVEFNNNIIISALFNVIILRFGRLLNIKVLFSKYYVKKQI
jgi:hypothetical protein